MTFEIMMPFWWRFDHLQEAVASVLAQDDEDWRLTVVDDVFPDPAPGEWVRAVGDPRVTYLRNEQNLRPSGNYNKCVSLASEDFVTILGCDDVLGRRYVRRVKELIAEYPDVDLIQPGVSVINEDGKEIRPMADRVKARLVPRGVKPALLSGERLAVSLLRGNWTYFPSLVWRRSWLAERAFRRDLDVVQDLEMIMHIVVAGGSLLVDDQPSFSFRRHSTSVSAVTGPDGTKYAQERVLFREAAAACGDIGWRRARRAASNHLTSRLNALSDLPAAVRLRTGAGARALLRHALGS